METASGRGWTRRPRLLELESFFLFPAGVESLHAARLSATFSEAEGLRAGVRRVAESAAAAARLGAGILIIDDDGPDLPIPAVLAVGAAHRRLLADGVRSTTSIVVSHDEPRSLKIRQQRAQLRTVHFLGIAGDCQFLDRSTDTHWPESQLAAWAGLRCELLASNSFALF